jgi:hypothetical protein
LRFEFEVGDLVEIIARQQSKNLSMHEARRAQLTIETLTAVVIQKRLDESGHGIPVYMYTIRTVDGRTQTRREGIYPIGHFKNE